MASKALMMDLHIFTGPSEPPVVVVGGIFRSGSLRMFMTLRAGWYVLFG
eukprot:CAMPEP_0197929900 /NCGR_PEP_ID=MMETSP1439-20131203/104576_1 /TAXON_ID=66791 /ORGANISM="Gonyaulax spinifera, Strain CCMP409" /LENGTH=48 /DNA_ID= /DNA_START= /DNA_END= /DNA_ORIENTATION=